MHVSSLALVGAFFSALAASQELDNLQQGLINNLKVTPSTREKFKAGWMPKTCMDIANKEKKNPTDFQVWKVKYNDCSEPWIMCYHKDSNQPLDDLINTFGRLPVHTRDFVRHLISVPSSKWEASNVDGNIVFFGPTLNNLPVHIHESAHSLDSQKAFPANQLPKSPQWLQAYEKDSAVLDRYSKETQAENVAQFTVAASYGNNVLGGLEKMVKGFGKVKNQKRLPNSEAVKIGGGAKSRVMGARALDEEDEEKPDVGFKDTELEILEVVPIDTRESCKGTKFV
ncbi:MAG: hypothetical protein Q9221_004956 [Calogaya cf. arnoldii]